MGGWDGEDVRGGVDDDYEPGALELMDRLAAEEEGEVVIGMEENKRRPVVEERAGEGFDAMQDVCRVHAWGGGVLQFGTGKASEGGEGVLMRGGRELSYQVRSVRQRTPPLIVL